MPQEAPRAQSVAPAGFRTATTWANIASYLAIFVGVPYAAFLVLGQTLFVTRAFVLAEYLILAWLSRYLRTWTVIALFCSLLTVEVALQLVSAYYLELADLRLYIWDLRSLSPFRSAEFSAVALWWIGTIVLSSIAIGRSAARVRAVSPKVTAVLLGTLILADVMNGSASHIVRFSERQIVPANIFNSLGWIVTRAARTGLAAATAPAAPAESAATASGLAALIDSPTFRDNVMVVTVESLGELRDTRLQADLFADLLALQNTGRYAIRQGSVPFHGSTTAGTLRDLCGSTISYRQVMTAEQLDCLPHRLQERGFETIAVHGYSSRVFERDRWYPRIGFSRLWFAEQLGTTDLRERCGGVHRGFCDDALVGFVSTQLKDRPEVPKLLYFLTLNTHIPYDMPPGRQWAYACGAEKAPTTDRAVCDLMNLWRLTFSQLAAALADPSLPPTHVLIVGDHAPPLFHAASRAMFEPARVPWLLLESTSSQ